MGSFLTYTWDLIVRGGSAAAGFLGGMNARANGGLTLLLLLMAADYVTGVIAAALGKSRHTAHGGISSEAGWKGLLRKALTLLVVLLSVLLDRFVNQGNAMFQSAVTWFYISNEAISLVENLARCGVPVPRKVRATLEQMRRDDELSPPKQMHSSDSAEESPPFTQNALTVGAIGPRHARREHRRANISTSNGDCLRMSRNSSTNASVSSNERSNPPTMLTFSRVKSDMPPTDVGSSDIADPHVSTMYPRYGITSPNHERVSPPYDADASVSRDQSPQSVDPCAAFRVPEHRLHMRRMPRDRRE